MACQKKVATKKKVPQLTERENYLRNRNNMVEDFKSALKEVQRDKPSVGGEIAGMNYQQFSASMVFFSIVEQEKYIEYTKKYKLFYVVLSEEEVLLEDLVRQAKEVFGEYYQEWYLQKKSEDEEV